MVGFFIFKKYFYNVPYIFLGNLKGQKLGSLKVKMSKERWTLHHRASLHCLPLDLSSALGGSWPLGSVQQGHLAESLTSFSRQSHRSHKSTRSDATAAARIIQKTWFTAEEQRHISDLRCCPGRGRYFAVFRNDLCVSRGSHQW